MPGDYVSKVLKEALIEIHTKGILKASVKESYLIALKERGFITIGNIGVNNMRGFVLSDKGLKAIDLHR